MTVLLNYHIGRVFCKYGRLSISVRLWYVVVCVWYVVVCIWYVVVCVWYEAQAHDQCGNSTE